MSRAKFVYLSAVDTRAKFQLVVSTMLLTVAVYRFLQRLDDTHAALLLPIDVVAFAAQVLTASCGILSGFAPRLRTATASIWLVLLMELLLFTQLYAHGSRKLAHCQGLADPADHLACTDELRGHVFVASLTLTAVVGCIFSAAVALRQAIAVADAESDATDAVMWHPECCAAADCADDAVEVA